ncbi:hypothetical protein [Streptomyces uncialis]|uniref:hypothetical protein n=1 Tax=Streptomyces uncialis TaxID=1048205 RepID=UPI0037965C33
MSRGRRAAALRLTTAAYPGLADEVEAALHTCGSAQRPDQYTDPVGVAGLIVSIATFAWTDIRSRTGNTPAPDTVSRPVRQELDRADTEPQTGPAERDRIIDITVEVTLDIVRDQDTDQP